MKKAQARAQLARLASSRGLSVKFTLGNKVERVTVLNSSKKPVATGQLKLTATGDYSANDFISIKASLAQVKAAGTKPAKKTLNSGTSGSVPKPFSNRKKMNCSRNIEEDFPDYEADVDGAAFSEKFIELMESYGFEDAYEEPSVQNGSGTDFITGTLKGKDYSFKKDYYDEVALIMDLGPEEAAQWVFEEFLKKIGLNSSSRKSSRKKMNSSKGDEFEGDDAAFVDDAEGVVQDQDGNEIVVEDMLIVQDPDTAEISLFIPDDTDDTVPESVEVIGEVRPSDDTSALDSSRRILKRGTRLNAAKAKPARKKVKTNCSTSPKLSAADQEKILGLFSKAGVKVTSSFDDTDTHDGVAYNLFCVETENRSVPVRGSLQSDLRELESQDIGYDIEVGPNGFYSRTYQFYYYEDEPTSENRCWHARPRV